MAPWSTAGGSPVSRSPTATSSASDTRCWSTGRTGRDRAREVTHEQSTPRHAADERQRGGRVTAEIVLQIFRFGFLLLLWLFIFAAFRVVRADLFGGRTGRVASVPPRAAAAVTGRKRGQRGPKTLVVTAGPLTGTKITLGDQPILIGRADDS